MWPWCRVSRSLRQNKFAALPLWHRITFASLPRLLLTLTIVYLHEYGVHRVVALNAVDKLFRSTVFFGGLVWHVFSYFSKMIGENMIFFFRLFCETRDSSCVPIFFIVGYPGQGYCHSISSFLYRLAYPPGVDIGAFSPSTSPLDHPLILLMPPHRRTRASIACERCKRRKTKAST